MFQLNLNKSLVTVTKLVLWVYQSALIIDFHVSEGRREFFRWSFNMGMYERQQ